MILDKIAASTRLRVEAAKQTITLEQMKEMAYACPNENPFAFEKALQKPGISFICEVKKASPSKGLIAEHFPYVQIAREYEEAGADCISVLTEPDYFLGSDAYLREIAQTVSVPVIRKDFIIDEYQIYEAKTLGASAVLLICALLDTETVRDYLQICGRLGLSAIVEAHDEAEVASAAKAGAGIIGVNNRSLKTFEVDIHNSMRLRSLVPGDVIFVAESGIRTREDIAALEAGSVDAVLIGETLMRSEHKKEMLDSLRGKPCGNPPRIKICGLTRAEDIAYVNELLPDYIGFVFWERSRRCLDIDTAKRLKELLDKRIQAVGVFVDAEPALIQRLCGEGVIDMIQLHGSEDAAYIQKIKRLTGKPVIKAVRMKDKEQSAYAVEQADTLPCDYLLLDTYTEHTAGGSGKTFDHSIIPHITKPFFLAGGLDAANIGNAIAAAGAVIYPYAVDVSSGVETDGVKSYDKIKELITAVKKGGASI